MQDRGSNLIRQTFKVYTLAALRANDGGMLLSHPISGVLEQIGPELRLFLLQPFDLESDIGQAICGMAVQHARLLRRNETGKEEIFLST
jgi:hypothetical protein